MRNLILNFIESYKQKKLKIDKNQNYYRLLLQIIPNKLREILNRNDLLIIGSTGQGYVAEIPWICILNTTITRSAQHGLYIAILFKKDLSGFYLTLSQGITNFENKFKNKATTYAKKVAKYFQNEIKEDNYGFSFLPCSLGSNKKLAKGYESTCILEKFYDLKFEEDEFIQDVKNLLLIYDEIVSHINPGNTYDEIVKNILIGFDEKLAIENANEALDNMMNVIKKHMTTIDQTLIPVTAKQERTKRYRELTQPMISKIDYVEKAEINAITGLNGERLALQFELKKIENLISQNKLTPDYLDKVKHVSQQTDSAGYDILSYDIDNDGNIHEIYIEVKTTTNKKDTCFFVSNNELNKSKKYKENYYVFRIYDCNSVTPKYYLANGELEKNFYIDPISFRCLYKYQLA